VGTDHETVATAIGTVVDGNDVTGLFIVHCCIWEGKGWGGSWGEVMDRMDMNPGIICCVCVVHARFVG
jgi:hypothetical protein